VTAGFAERRAGPPTAVGLSQGTRKRRGHGPRKYIPIDGRVVNDYVEPVNLRDEWDIAANGTLDPAVVKGSYRKKVWWVCRAHADGPESHLHRWQTSVAQRATLQTGCPYCFNREVCAWNNLAKSRPDIAKMWDQDANGEVTPFDVLPGMSDEYLWRCETDPAHPPFKARISQVAGQGARCRLSHPEQRLARAQAKATIRVRMHRELARQALPAAPGQMAETVTAPEVAPQVAAPDEQGTFWDALVLPPEPQLDLFDVA